MWPQKKSYINVHSSSIHNSQTSKTTEMFIKGEWIDKHRDEAETDAVMHDLEHTMLSKRKNLVTNSHIVHHDHPTDVKRPEKTNL